jgi:hypothetical protein
LGKGDGQGGPLPSRPGSARQNPAQNATNQHRASKKKQENPFAAKNPRHRMSDDKGFTFVEVAFGEVGRRAANNAPIGSG